VCVSAFCPHSVRAVPPDAFGVRTMPRALFEILADDELACVLAFADLTSKKWRVCRRWGRLYTQRSQIWMSRAIRCDSTAAALGELPLAARHGIQTLVLTHSRQMRLPDLTGLKILHKLVFHKQQYEGSAVVELTFQSAWSPPLLRSLDITGVLMTSVDSTRFLRQLPQLTAASVNVVDFTLTRQDVPNLEELVLARGDLLQHFALDRIASVLGGLKRFEVRRIETPARLHHLLIFPYQRLESLKVAGEIDDDDLDRETGQPVGRAPAYVETSAVCSTLHRVDIDVNHIEEFPTAFQFVGAFLAQCGALQHARIAWRATPKVEVIPFLMVQSLRSLVLDTPLTATRAVWVQFCKAAVELKELTIHDPNPHHMRGLVMLTDLTSLVIHVPDSSKTEWRASSVQCIYQCRNLRQFEGSGLALPWDFIDGLAINNAFLSDARLIRCAMLLPVATSRSFHPARLVAAREKDVDCHVCSGGGGEGGQAQCCRGSGQRDS
jgi:hypothetical protein